MRARGLKKIRGQRLFPTINSTALVVALCWSAACSATGDTRAAVDSESAGAVPKSDGVIAPDIATRTLAIAAGAAPYHEDENPVAPGSITGSVRLNGALPVDTTVTPDRDSTGCRPFQDVTLPKARGARNASSDSADIAIANAVAWLVGVTHGPRLSLPRRVSMVLDGCHFEPRILLAPVGATMIMSNRDEMITKLSFVDHGVANARPREEIGFTDPGQLVPSGKALANAGLVEVRDANHSWVRAFIAVAPHPFVAVTEADGNFLFEGVPAGSYQLVVWHERLGARVMPVLVEQGVATIIRVGFGAP